MRFTTIWPITGFLLNYLVRVHAQELFQPIGIDFGSELITAAYAYSLDNVSILAAIHPQPGDSYSSNMFYVRMEYFKQQKVGDLYGYPNLRGIIMGLRRYFFSKMTSHMPFLEHPALKESKALQWSGIALNYIFETFLNNIGLGDPMSELDALTPDSFKIGFVEELEILKQKVLEEHEIDISSAIVSIPDFFNQTLASLVLDACDESDISNALAVERTVAATFGPTFGIEKDEARYLLIEHTQFYTDLRTYYGGKEKNKRGMRQQNLPMDPYGSISIDRQLTERLVKNSDVLQQQIYFGANENDLWGHVARARFLIKDNIDREVYGEGVDEDHHHEEYPMHLGDWGEGGLEVVLSWEDVQAVEDEYVKTLGNNIRNFLIALRQTRDLEGSTNEELPEEIDKVIILTSRLDGGLVQRAVRVALGQHIEIEGGTLHDFGLAARGSARGALHRSNAWNSAMEKRNRRAEQTHDEL